MQQAKNRCYGITHELDGTPRIIEPKTVKVGIGLAKGPWIHVYIDLNRKWVVQVGKDEIKRFEAKFEARRFYRDAKRTAPERQYPQRLAYFTFSRVSPDGSFEPDWEAIESHGPLPTEIDIVFIRDDSFSASYQMWTATEKKCDGDGLNAMRINSMAATAEEKELAATASARGEKYFPIVNGCWMKGCPYSKAQGENGRSPCAPHGRLLFQLLNSPRLGGTSYFDTRGFRSVSQIFSCIEIFKGVTGSGNAERGFVAGIPLKLILRPYKTNFGGRPTTQYGVSLEFRQESVLALKRSLVEHGVQFRVAGTEPLRRLNPAAEFPELPARPDPDENPVALENEFPRQSSEDDAARSPEPDDDYDEVAPELARCWDETQSETAAPQVGAASPAGATELFSAARRTFYEVCRAKGMNDRQISEKIGSLGYETLGEVPERLLPELTEWANGSIPIQHQGSLL